MRTAVKTTDVYKYSELSDEAKEHALNKLSDVNVDYEWWDGVYMDAENVGIKITEFDLDRNRYAKGHFILSAHEVAANIIRDHGETCETYKTAEAFLNEVNAQSMPDDDSDDFPAWKEKMLELEDEFQKSILEDYSIMLQKESEYLQSRESIEKTIDANDYEFTVDGNLYH
jgi:L-rhamnose mutarotase